MRGIVFSIEALLSLLAAILFLLFASPQNIDLSYKSVYEHSLVQDFLETSVKNKALARELAGFCKGDVFSKTSLSENYASLLKETGAECLRVSCGSQLLEAGCGSGNGSASANKTRAVAGTRLLYDAQENVFKEVRFTLYFAS